MDQLNYLFFKQNAHPLQFRRIYFRDNDNKLNLMLIEIVSVLRACLSEMYRRTSRNEETVYHRERQN